MGRNNSGKSNLLDAISCLHGLTASDFDGTLQARGGYQSVVFGKDPALTATLGATFELPEAQHAGLIRTAMSQVPRLHQAMLEQNKWGRRVVYSVAFRGTSFHESLTLDWNEAKYPVLQGDWEKGTYNFRQARLVLHLQHFAEGRPFETPLDAARALGSGSPIAGFRTAVSDDGIAQSFQRLLQETLQNLILRIGPIRNPAVTAPITGPSSLKEDGANLADWLDYHRSNNPRRFREFVEEFRVLVPEVKEVSTPRLGGAVTTASMEEFWVATPSGFDLASSSMGERNLMTIIGHLVERRPCLILAMEEPENSIHPQAQHQLGRTLWRLAGGRQVLVTTHSPALLSMFPLSSLRLVTRDNGATDVADVSGSNAGFVLSELGVHPSDLLDFDALVFVEGETDAKVYDAWMEASRRASLSPQSIQGRALFVGVRGLTNLPFYLDSQLLKARVVKPNVYHIVDGDVLTDEATQSQWKLVRTHLPVAEENTFMLPEGRVLEDYLLVPATIHRCFPAQFPSEADVKALLPTEPTRGNASKDALKNLLAARNVRYSVDVAERIARAMHVEEIAKEIQDILSRIRATTVV